MAKLHRTNPFYFVDKKRKQPVFTLDRCLLAGVLCLTAYGVAQNTFLSRTGAGASATLATAGNTATAGGGGSLFDTFNAIGKALDNN